jgi:hypothetical protein
VQRVLQQLQGRADLALTQIRFAQIDFQHRVEMPIVALSPPSAPRSSSMSG